MNVKVESVKLRQQAGKIRDKLKAKKSDKNIGHLSEPHKYKNEHAKQSQAERKKE
jgi:hypothetical protein